MWIDGPVAGLEAHLLFALICTPRSEGGTAPVPGIAKPLVCMRKGESR